MATFTELTELTASPEDGDQFLIRDVSSGTEKRATFDNLFGTAARKDTGNTADDVPLNSDATGLTWPDEETGQEWQITFIDGVMYSAEV